LNERAKALWFHLRRSIPLIIWIATSFLSGCTLIEYPRGKIYHPLPSVEEVIGNLKKRSDGIRSMRGIMNIQVRSLQRSYNVQQAFQIQKPSKIRIQTLGIFGQPVLFLTTEGSNLTIFVPSEKRAYIGDASPQNLSIGIPIPFSPPQIVKLLTGEIPIYENNGFIYEIDQDNGLLRLDTVNKNLDFGRLRLWIDLGKWTVVKGELLNEREDLVWKIVYNRFRYERGFNLPFYIDVEIAGGQTRASIELEDVEINPDIRDDSFRLNIPEGTEIRFIR
jgi:outer membrane lipoprotein-sorting protein